jgi:short-subunit dehydrogenase
MRKNLKPLSEQTLVITGASSGIGLATARMAAERGARVLLVARNQPALDIIAKEVGANAAVCAIDIADDGAAERISEAATKAFGGFDTWVNCASVTSYGSLEQIGIDEHRRQFDVNYFAMLACSLAAVRHLRERGGGAVINIGSILSDRAVIGQPAYSASKAAVRALTDGIRMDVEREGLPISVTLIKPSGIHTPFPEHGRNHMNEAPRIPQVIYAPEIAADAILFAAEHSRRQLYIGGFGFASVLAAQLFPRLTDKIMEATMLRAQQSPDEPGDPAMRDNLYEPRKDGLEHGTQDVAFRRSSLFVEAQKHPLAVTALVGAAAATGAAALSARRRRELAGT